jgi:NAD(P)-dependent dehydrogenase (short-subunit alcohol dehydrogenase family)
MTQKKVAVITGAAGGIGKETARRFYREGYHLMLSDINGPGLDSLQQELKQQNAGEGDIISLAGDFVDLDYVRSLVGTCREQWRRVDVLVNNAVWRTHDTMRSITLENWEKTIRIGLTAPAFLAKWAAELMERQQIAGAIINISSVMAKRATGASPAYTVCKGAIESLTYELAALYGPAGIRVVALAPGNVQTPLSQDYTGSSGENISAKMEQNMNDQTPLQRPAQSREIANAIYWLSSAEASFISGTVVEADGGFSHGFSNYSLKRLQYPDEF